MEPTKNEVAASVTNQQALVKRIIQSTAPKPTRTYIPGGKNMLDEISQAKLEAAVFNYLRRHRWFDRFRLSFAAETDGMELVVTKVRDFPVTNGYAIWEQPAHGKRWLAGVIADTLLRDRFIYVEARKDGLYAAKESGESTFDAESDNWLPHYDMWPIRRGEYAINM